MCQKRVSPTAFRGPKGAGDKELLRNTPTVLNVAFFSGLLWDGRASSLEEQALLPIETPDEMAQDADSLAGELAAVPSYAEQFRQVFGRPVNTQDIARALAAYQRSLITPDSPFDRYLAGEEDALSLVAKEGLELFRGAAGASAATTGLCSAMGSTIGSALAGLTGDVPV